MPIFNDLNLDNWKESEILRKYILILKTNHENKFTYCYCKFS